MLGDWCIFRCHDAYASRVEGFGGTFTLPPRLDVGVVREDDTLELRIVKIREDVVTEAADSVDACELN
jgi:hypothetical protein